MVTTTSVEVAPLAPATRPRGRSLAARIALGLAAGLVMVPVVVAGGMYAWDASYEGRVLPGVQAAGVDLSGLDRRHVIAALGPASDRYAAGKVVILTPDAPVTIDYRAVGRRLDTAAMAEEALNAGRIGSPLQRATGEIRQALDGHTVALRLVVDETTLRASVRAALEALAWTPLDAVARESDAGFHATTAMPGRVFDADAVADAALAALRQLDAPATVRVQAVATPVPPKVTSEMVLEATTAAERMATAVVVTLDGRKWTIPASVVRSWVGLRTGSDGIPTANLDETGIAASLAAVKKAVAVKAVSAQFLMAKDGSIAGVKAGRNGRQLDTAATAAAIALEVRARAAGTAPAPVRLVVATVQPEVTTEQARKSAPLMKRLSSWKTWFPIADRNYWGRNIWIPARLINGTVLKPGQTFSWWRAVGPVTAARGFGLGGYIAGDHTEPTGAIGGGMCSSSTTLFNAALRAGLQMGMRANHRYYINRYPLGLDATVSGSQTMTFTNDMRTPILIRGYKIVGKGGIGWVKYEIWGVPDGRTVKIGRPVISNVDRAVTHVIETSALKHGQRKQTEYPANGMNVQVTRTVRNAHGSVLHREVWRTHYVRWDGVILVGK